MLDNRRHRELFDSAEFELAVWVFGSGGTGGEVARCLTGLGVGTQLAPLHLCDHDVFESHNVPTQLVSYEQAEQGMAKVVALRDNLLRINPKAVIHAHQCEAPHWTLPAVAGVAFLCTDTMLSRRAIVEDLLEGNADVRCVIDLRVDVPGAISYCFDPNDPFQVNCYFDYWYDDDEADELLGCNSEHFALRSSFLGGVVLAMKDRKSTRLNSSMEEVPNFTRLLYDVGEYTREFWHNPNVTT